MENNVGRSVDLTGKTVLVTGGSLGLGNASAQACLEAGASVGICARNPDDLKEALNRFYKAGYRDRVIGAPADVTHPRDVERTIQELSERFAPVTGVIHAAGVYGPIGEITTIGAEEWFDAVRINLYGSFLVTRIACTFMKRNGGGRIVLFSGGGAGSAFPYYDAYACSKAAVVRLTENIAIEMARYGIEVNCIAPGFVVTRLHEATIQAGKLAGSEFLEKTKQQLRAGGVQASVGAKAAAFLVSDTSKGITGKFVAAPYDDYTSWLDRGDDLKGDVFTLRRIVPKDRGMNWQ